VPPNHQLHNFRLVLSGWVHAHDSFDVSITAAARSWSRIAIAIATSSAPVLLVVSCGG
jgi:hypothetical protein